MTCMHTDEFKTVKNSICVLLLFSCSLLLPSSLLSLHMFLCLSVSLSQLPMPHINYSILKKPQKKNPAYAHLSDRDRIDYTHTHTHTPEWENKNKYIKMKTKVNMGKSREVEDDSQGLGYESACQNTCCSGVKAWAWVPAPRTEVRNGCVQASHATPEGLRWEACVGL